MTVSVLLVSHDGERWLPRVLDGLQAQSLPPDRIVAVDTGSRDRSTVLLSGRLGSAAVTEFPDCCSFQAAVQAGLAALGPNDDSLGEWIWLLHDDSAPAPEALEQLLAAVRRQPSATVFGSKLREWPSMPRLLEVGVTISGTGHRETGLERDEYDQGQHDRYRDVLAVNTAGMLVRRDVLEHMGFDEQLAWFGNDIDFGWRAARSGARVVVVPQAVVFHAEAAHRGLRRTPAGTPRRAERRAALYTILVNCAPAALAFQAPRLLLGSLIRALGHLLVRDPGAAVDEIAALSVYLHPVKIRSGRAARRRVATVPGSTVRHLLAPAWTPYRHGLDALSDLFGGAGLFEPAGLSEPKETGPVPADVENLPEDTGLLVRLLRNPAAMGLLLLVLLAVVAMRGLLGTGMLTGGALLPAPASATTWWQTYLQSWHHTDIGSGAPAAPYLLPMALLGTVALGKAWLVVDVVFLLAVPLCALGGYRFLRPVTGSRTASLWGGAVYGLLPVLGGAVQQGRLGTVAVALVLPWVAHAAWFSVGKHSSDRRWRAAWRTALWLAVATAFAPIAWLMAAAAILVALGWLLVRRASATVLTPSVTAVLVVPVLLLPWSLHRWSGGVGLWSSEAGLPAAQLLSHLDRWAIVLGRPGVVGAAPGWLSAGLVLAAVASLLRTDTRARVLAAWAVIVLGLATTAALSPRGAWLGVPLLVVQAAAVSATALAGAGIGSRLTGKSFGWRQPVGLVAVVAALLTPVAGLVWWVGAGDAGPLERRAPTGVPTYMTDAAVADPDHGVLVISGSSRNGFEYSILRGNGRRLGQDSLGSESPAQRPLTALVARLATGAGSHDVDTLADYGVQFVYASSPADSRLVGSLDSVSGLVTASALQPASRAWQLEQIATGAALPVEPGRSYRPWLLAAQALALVCAGVLAAPTRRNPR